MQARVTLCLTIAAAGLITTVLVSGCKGGGGQDPNKLGAKYTQLFASADAETRGYWDTANLALATNGFAVAIQALQSLLLETNLSPEQTSAAGQTATAVSDKMYAAANKGDANARQAIEELRKARSR
jgi:hypothetical protein